MKEKKFSIYLAIAGRLDATFRKACTNAQGELNKLGKAATLLKYAGIASIGAFAVESAKKLINLGESFEEAYKKIRVGTGATGDTLKGLEDSMNNVYSAVPTSIEDASTAISDFNTRLGVEGGTLEELSEQALLVNKMLGEDVSSITKDSAQALQQWKINQKDMSTEMDYAFRVAQSTGIGFTDLMSNMSKYGATLQILGYNFDTAATLLGKLNKAGYNTEQVFAGLKKAVSTLSTQGIDTAQGLQIYYDQIRNAKDETEAITIATQVFGTEAGGTLAKAIRDGTLDVKDLTKQLEAGGDTIKGVGEETYTFADKMQQMKQKLSAKLEPIAMAFIDKLDELSPLLDTVGDLLSVIFQAVQGLDNAFGVMQMWTNWLQSLMNILKEIATFVKDVFTGNWKDAFKQIGNIAISVLNGIILGFQNMINFVIHIINNLTQGLSSLWSWAGIPKIPKVPEVHINLIPTLAEGGIINSPTLALVGEGKEPEAVIPLSKLSEMLTSNNYKTINDNNTNNAFNPNITINISTQEKSQLTETIKQNLTEELDNWWNNKLRYERRVSL